MSSTLDTAITIALFVALVPAVVFAFYAGFTLIMLGDGVSGDRSFRGVLLGVVGVPLSAVLTYAAAVILACTATGYTFYYPIVALVVGGPLAWGISTLAHRLVRRQ